MCFPFFFLFLNNIDIEYVAASETIKFYFWLLTQNMVHSLSLVLPDVYNRAFWMLCFLASIKATATIFIWSDTGYPFVSFEYNTASIGTMDAKISWVISGDIDIYQSQSELSQAQSKVNRHWAVWFESMLERLILLIWW